MNVLTIAGKTEDDNKKVSVITKNYETFSFLSYSETKRKLKYRDN